MTDNPVPENSEMIAAKIDALSKSNDERFARAGQQIEDLLKIVEGSFDSS